VFPVDVVEPAQTGVEIVRRRFALGEIEVEALDGAEDDPVVWLSCRGAGMRETGV